MNKAFEDLRLALDNLRDAIVQEWHDHKWRLITMYVIVVLITIVIDVWFR